MYQQDVEAVLDAALEVDGIDEYREYSGRGMFGKTCRGFVVGRDVSLPCFIARWLEAVTHNSDDEDELRTHLEAFSELLENMATDNLGLDMVVYFPRFN